MIRVEGSGSNVGVEPPPQVVTTSSLAPHSNASSTIESHAKSSVGAIEILGMILWFPVNLVYNVWVGAKVSWRIITAPLRWVGLMKPLQTEIKNWDNRKEAMESEFDAKSHLERLKLFKYPLAQLNHQEAPGFFRELFRKQDIVILRTLSSHICGVLYGHNAVSPENLQKKIPDMLHAVLRKNTSDMTADDLILYGAYEGYLMSFPDYVIENAEYALKSDSTSLRMEALALLCEMMESTERHYPDFYLNGSTLEETQTKLKEAFDTTYCNLPAEEKGILWKKTYPYDSKRGDEAMVKSIVKARNEPSIIQFFEQKAGYTNISESAFRNFLIRTTKPEEYAQVCEENKEVQLDLLREIEKTLLDSTNEFKLTIVRSVYEEQDQVSIPRLKRIAISPSEGTIADDNAKILRYNHKLMLQLLLAYRKAWSESHATEFGDAEVGAMRGFDEAWADFVEIGSNPETGEPMAKIKSGQHQLLREKMQEAQHEQEYKIAAANVLIGMGEKSLLGEIDKQEASPILTSSGDIPRLEHAVNQEENSEADSNAFFLRRWANSAISMVSGDRSTLSNWDKLNLRVQDASTDVERLNILLDAHQIQSIDGREVVELMKSAYNRLSSPAKNRLIRFLVSQRKSLEHMFRYISQYQLCHSRAPDREATEFISSLKVFLTKGLLGSATKQAEKIIQDNPKKVGVQLDALFNILYSYGDEKSKEEAFFKCFALLSKEAKNRVHREFLEKGRPMISVTSPAYLNLGLSTYSSEKLKLLLSKTFTSKELLEAAQRYQNAGHAIGARRMIELLKKLHIEQHDQLEFIEATLVRSNGANQQLLVDSDPLNSIAIDTVRTLIEQMG